jgi:protein tyrosine phosphatase (PTP) superfamily phosphohydrolase (DUF442 family)
MFDPDALPRIANASQVLPWLVTSGQPSAEQLQQAARAGIKAVIDLRDPMEPRGFDEPRVAREAQLDYTNIPVVTGATTDEDMARVLAALAAHAGTPTLLHCASANRTGGPLIAWLMLHEHRAEPDAVTTAMRSGLRSAEMMEWAVDYARRHTGG